MKSSDDDVIFYIDAGCHINQKNISRLKILLDITKSLNNQLFAGLAFKLENFRKIKKYTKPSLLELFPQIKSELPQLAATYLMFKVNNNSRDFLKRMAKFSM